MEFSKKPWHLEEICWTHAILHIQTVLIVAQSGGVHSSTCNVQECKTKRVPKVHTKNIPSLILSQSAQTVVGLFLRSSTAAPGVRKILWEPQGAGVFSRTIQWLRAEMYPSRFPQINSLTHLISCQWSLRLDSPNPPRVQNPEEKKTKLNAVVH